MPRLAIAMLSHDGNCLTPIPTGPAAAFRAAFRAAFAPPTLHPLPE
jgi:hypothetical protein